MKNTFYLSLALLGMLLTSCQFDDNGDISISPFGWLIIIGIIIFFVYAVVSENKKQKETAEKMKKRGMNYSQFIDVGTYVGGHPEINENVPSVRLRKVDNSFYLYKVVGLSMPTMVSWSEIPIDTISNITVEDSSSIEHKITLGRILLVGIFALAWRKKKKNELAFVVIEWKKGKFEHSTIFSFEGTDAMKKANTARNKLIKECE